MHTYSTLLQDSRYCRVLSSSLGDRSSPSSLRLAILIKVRAIPLVVVYLNAGPVSPQLKLSLRTHSATNHPVHHHQLFIRVYTDTSKTLSAALLTDGMSGEEPTLGQKGHHQVWPGDRSAQPQHPQNSCSLDPSPHSHQAWLCFGWS